MKAGKNIIYIVLMALYLSSCGGGGGSSSQEVANNSESSIDKTYDMGDYLLMSRVKGNVKYHEFFGYIGGGGPNFGARIDGEIELLDTGLYNISVKTPGLFGSHTGEGKWLLRDDSVFFLGSHPSSYLFYRGERFMKIGDYVGTIGGHECELADHLVEFDAGNLTTQLYGHKYEDVLRVDCEDKIDENLSYIHRKYYVKGHGLALSVRYSLDRGFEKMLQHTSISIR